MNAALSFKYVAAEFTEAQGEDPLISVLATPPSSKNSVTAEKY